MTKSQAKFLIVAFSLMVCWSGHAREAESIPALIRQFETSPVGKTVAKERVQAIRIGLHAYSLSEDQELMSYRADQLFNPASNMKLISTAALLHYLGADFRIKTPYLTDYPPNQGRIQNLYVAGRGDPSMTTERLWSTARHLALQGITRVTGDLVIDQGYFDNSSYQGPLGDAAKVYLAPITAYSVNQNSFTARVYPGNRGAPVVLDPPIPYFKLVTQLNGDGTNSLSLTRVFNQREGWERVVVKGGLQPAQPLALQRSVSRPSLYAGHCLKWVLGQNGIAVQGGIREGSVEGAHLLYEDISPPLYEMVDRINKESSNLTAEVLAKVLGAHFLEPPGTTAKAIFLIREYLRDIGVLTPDAVLTNASGLARTTRVTPRVLTQLLRTIRGRFPLEADWISSLAVAGREGTMAARFLIPELEGRARVKTGRLNDVNALSGFIPTRSGGLVVFSLLIEGSGAGSERFYPLQEKIAWQLYHD